MQSVCGIPRRSSPVGRAHICLSKGSVQLHLHHVHAAAPPAKPSRPIRSDDADSGPGPYDVKLSFSSTRKRAPGFSFGHAPSNQ
jgi:hypothetical protein